MRAKVNKIGIVAIYSLLTFLASGSYAQTQNQPLHSFDARKIELLSAKLLSNPSSAGLSQTSGRAFIASSSTSKPQITTPRALRNPNTGGVVNTSKSTLAAFKAQGIGAKPTGRLHASNQPASKALMDSLERQLSSGHKQDLSKLREVSADKRLKLRFGQNRIIRELRGRFKQKGAKNEPVVAAESFLRQHPTLFGISNHTEFSNSKNCSGTICRVKLKRRYKGLDVWGGEVVVAIVGDEVRAVMGDLESNELEVSLDPTLTDEMIKNIALEHFQRSEADLSEPVIVRRGVNHHSSHRVVAYRATVHFGVAESYDVYIEERTGRVINVISRIYSSFVDSQGVDLSGDMQSFRSETYNGGFRMHDDSFQSGSVTRVLTSNNTFDQYYEVYSSSSNSGWDPAAVSALKNAKKTEEYYLGKHGRSGLDGEGNPTTSVVNYGDPSSGAYYVNGLVMYGSGNNVETSNLAKALDVAGHEMTHGVISNTSNLTYQYQSGALNESFADFFGTMIENDNWLIGEEVWLASPGYARSLSDPASAGQPAHMLDYENLPNTQEGDNGGVHRNSGIPNRALYLIAEGLTVEGLGASIGRLKTERIAYQTMVGLPSNADFLDAASDLSLTAAALYGENSEEQRAVIDGFSQVGIDVSSSAPPIAPIPPLSGDANLVAYLSPSSNYQNVYVQVFFNDFTGFNAELDVQFNTYPASRKRPSIISDSEGDAFLLYFGIDNSLILVDLKTSENIVLEAASDIQTAVIAPETNSFAVTRGLGEIDVCNFTTDVCETYEVTEPDYSEDGSGGIPAEFVDVVRFDPTGRQLVFDYATCQASTSGECIQQWSIGILNLNSGTIRHPFPGQPADIDVGYPAFSNLTDRYIAFDLIDYRNFAVNGKVDSHVFILDTYENSLSGVVDPDSGSNERAAFGMPSFTADDSAIVFQATHNDGASDYQMMYLAPLNDYVATKSYPSLNPYIASHPYSESLLDRPPSTTLTLSNEGLNFGEVSTTRLHSKELCVINTSPTIITTNPSSSSAAYLSTDIPASVLPAGRQICGEVFVDGRKLAAGASFSGTITFGNDGEAAPVVSISGFATSAEPPSTPQITNTDYGDEEIYLTVSDSGSSPVTSYTATCTDGTTQYTGTSTTSRITVSGLTNGVSYNCSVTATNAAGTSAASATSPSIVPEYTPVGLPIWLLYEASK